MVRIAQPGYPYDTVWYLAIPCLWSSSCARQLCPTFGVYHGHATHNAKSVEPCRSTVLTFFPTRRVYCPIFTTCRGTTCGETFHGIFHGTGHCGYKRNFISVSNRKQGEIEKRSKTFTVSRTPNEEPRRHRVAESVKELTKRKCMSRKH